ncbi:MAG: hypothetical protein K5897_11345 [Eubacterium sp.]|nr:hypothetical protein [Eubacterium sp.]
MSEKGNYGYARGLKRKRMLLMLVCFAFILTDVIISLVFFQTRKTLFVVLAAVMAIPFAKNLIGYLMLIKYEPLTKEGHAEAEKIAEERGTTLAYDISVTASEGVLFYPCVAIYNNNVIGLLQAGQNTKKKDAVTYLKKVQEGPPTKPRVVVVDSLKELKRELDRLNPPKEDQIKADLLIAERLLELGY